jgi:tRNA threonylcarbamoyladenosine biosynthesis protein TsaE
MSEKIFELASLQDTRSFAERIARAVYATPTTSNVTIALNGTLGSGKTQWVRFFCEALGVAPQLVTSPTYVLLQRYRCHRIIFHFDFYRLESLAQVWDLGIDEVFEQPGIVLIEWADKFPDCLPDEHLTIRFAEQSGQRMASVSASCERFARMLQSMTD